MSQARDEDKRVEKVRSADGTEIAVFIRGSGPALVLVHGALSDHNLWNAIAPHLQNAFTLFAYDRRGRGASGDAAGYAIEREVEDLEAVVRLTSVQPVLFGHSSGAILSLIAATKDLPIRNLVLYEPPLIIEGYRSPYPIDLVDRLTALASTDPDSAIRTFLREGPLWSESDIEFLAQTPRWPSLLRLAKTAAYDARVVGDYKFEPDLLKTVQIETYVMLGDQSPEFYWAAMEALCDVLPRAEWVVFSGLGHMGVVTHPLSVADELLYLSRT